MLRDQVIYSRRFRGASNVLSPTACTGIPVFAEDVRVGKLRVRPLATRGLARFETTEAQQRYEIESGERFIIGIYGHFQYEYPFTSNYNTIKYITYNKSRFPYSVSAW